MLKNTFIIFSWAKGLWKWFDILLIFLHYVLIMISIPGSERSVLLAKFRRLTNIATDRDVKYLVTRKCLHVLSWMIMNSNKGI